MKRKYVLLDKWKEEFFKLKRRQKNLLKHYIWYPIIKNYALSVGLECDMGKSLKY